jgi:hypothetical protein
MGIEPTRAPLPELENTGFLAVRALKCDWRVNFCGIWDNTGIRWRRMTSRLGLSSLAAKCGIVRLTTWDVLAMSPDWRRRRRRGSLPMVK